MRKVLVVLTSVLLLTVSAALAGIYVILHSSYATQATNYFLKQIADVPVSVYETTYTFPYHFSFQGVEISEVQEQPINITQADIWLNPASLLQRTLVLDSVLINGISLQNGLPKITLPKEMVIHQLAITNLDYSDNLLISRDTSIQIENPLWIHEGQWLPYGEIQFSAEQIYWQQEAFNKVFLDIAYKPQNSTVYAASFNWREGKFSSQAEQYQQGWSLVNTTIEHFHLSAQEWRSLADNDWSLLTNHVFHINSLDFLSSSLHTDKLAIVNGDVSLENLYLDKPIWQQKAGYLSLNAESLRLHNYLLLSPLLESHFDPDLISIHELSVEFEQGLIQTSGKLSPTTASLERLNVDGVKWIYEMEGDFSLLTEYISGLERLSINRLDIARSQFIQLAHKPNWQVSGLSTKGESLLLVDKRKLGMWDGSLRLSANNASIQQLVANQPLIEMKTELGVWALTQAIIPLDKGLIESTATYSLKEVSQPWRVEAFVDGLPLEMITQWLDLPIQIKATIEFQASLKGLGGDKLMLEHSLSGELVGSLRDSVLVSNNQDEKVITLPFDSEPFAVNADRGRITVSTTSVAGKQLKSSVSGFIDLLQPDKSKNHLGAKVVSNCKEYQYDLLNASSSTRSICTSNKEK